MLQDSSTIPHYISQNWPAVAGFIAIAGWVAGWFSRRKREPVELEKLRAEARHLTATARSIEMATDRSLIDAAAEALTKANRVIDQCSHWERKAVALQVELDQAGTQERLDHLQIARLNGMVKVLASILEENEIKIPDDCRIS
jgi:hypothetical protein